MAPPVVALLCVNVQLVIDTIPFRLLIPPPLSSRLLAIVTSLRLSAILDFTMNTVALSSPDKVRLLDFGPGPLIVKLLMISIDLLSWIVPKTLTFISSPSAALPTASLNEQSLASHAPSSASSNLLTTSTLLAVVIAADVAGVCADTDGWLAIPAAARNKITIESGTNSRKLRI